MDKRQKEKALVRTSNGKRKEVVIDVESLNTGVGMAQFMAAVAVGTMQGTISPGAANASCSAIGKVLRILELRHKFGKKHIGPDFTVDGR